LKKNVFLYQNNWGAQTIWGVFIVPEHPPRTTDLPEIKAIIKGALPGMFPTVTCLLGRNT